jgi:lathosterol oxidase
MHGGCCCVCNFALVAYWGHRLMHTKWLYWAHKMHHEFHDVSVLASGYTHPVDMIISLLFPVSLAFGTMAHFGYPVHLLTGWQILLAGQWGVVYDHAGISPSAYDSIWNDGFGWLMSGVLPLCRTALAHDLHHRQFQYNFGARYLIYDRLFGTYKAPVQPILITQKHI